MTIDDEANEFLSCLVSMELAQKIARKYSEPVSAAIRGCAHACMGRVKSPRNYAVLDGIRKQPFPDGAVAMLRTRLPHYMTFSG